MYNSVKKRIYENEWNRRC